MAFYFTKYIKKASIRGERESNFPEYTPSEEYIFLQTGKEYRIGPRVRGKKVLRIKIKDENTVELRAAQYTRVLTTKLIENGEEHGDIFVPGIGSVDLTQQSFYVEGDKTNRVVWSANPLLETQGD